MLFAWMGAKGLLGLARGWWLLGAILAAIALYASFSGILDRMVGTAKDAGATEQREGDLRETITRTEKANDAAETVRRDPGAARAECLRNARNPEDC